MISLVRMDLASKDPHSTSIAFFIKAGLVVEMVMNFSVMTTFLEMTSFLLISTTHQVKEVCLDNLCVREGGECFFFSILLKKYIYINFFNCVLFQGLIC